MIPPPALIAALAMAVFLYCGWKTIGDFRARRWLWAGIGLLITLAAPLLLWAGSGMLSHWLANSPHSTQIRVRSANEAIRIGNRHLAGRMSPAILDMQRIEALDMGDRWRLAYIAPEGSTGGPIIIVINKRSGEIVHEETEQ